MTDQEAMHMWKKYLACISFFLLVSTLFSRDATFASKPNDTQVRDASFLTGLVGCELSTDSSAADNISLACRARHGLIMEVQGNYAYVALGSKLQILDVSQSSASKVISELDFSDDPVGADIILGSDLVGNYLYWVNGFGMHIINVSNPARPFQMGVFQIPPYQPPFGFIEVAGTYAYLTVNTSTNYDYRVALIDVSDPYHPVQIGDYLSVPDGKIRIIGQYAYIAHSGSSEYIAIYDISNPTAPTFISSYPVDLLGWDISGNYMYLTVLKWNNGHQDGSEFQVVSISNPRSPTLVGSYRANYLMSGLAKKDNYVYVGSDEELFVLDVSNPASPTKVGSYDHPGSIVSVIGNYAYAFEYYAGLTILDISTPTLMTAVGAYYFADTVVRTIAVSDYTYVAHHGGLWVLDNSDLEHPTLAGWLPSIIPVNMEISGTLAYIAGATHSSQGIHLVDLADPIAPTELGKYETTYEVVPFTPHIAPAGNYVYYYPGAGHLLVLDIFDLTSPQEVNSLSAPDLRDMVAADTALYLADASTMHIADIADPVHPTVVNAISMSDTQDLVVDGNRLYGLASNSLHVWDISAPITPTEIAALNIGGTRLAIEGQYAFITSNSGLQVLDISDLNIHPQVGFSSMTGSEIFVKDSVIYLSRGTGRLNIARFTGISRIFVPDQAGSIVYTDTQGLQTKIAVPTDTFSSTTILLYSPSPSYTALLGWADANHAFELSAFVEADESVALGGLSFSQPLTITIDYSDQDIALINDETKLALMYWDSNAWVDSSTICAPMNNDIDNRITIPICHTGMYALMGPTNQILLPYSAVFYHKN